MQIPLQITFRNLARSQAIEARVREYAENLEKFHDRITGCRVVVESRHRHHEQGNQYHVRVDVTVPNRKLVASRMNITHTRM